MATLEVRPLGDLHPAGGKRLPRFEDDRRVHPLRRLGCLASHRSGRALVAPDVGAGQEEPVPLLRLGEPVRDEDRLAPQAGDRLRREVAGEREDDGAPHRQREERQVRKGRAPEPRIPHPDRGEQPEHQREEERHGAEGLHPELARDQPLEDRRGEAGHGERGERHPEGEARKLVPPQREEHRQSRHRREQVVGLALRGDGVDEVEGEDVEPQLLLVAGEDAPAAPQVEEQRDQERDVDPGVLERAQPDLPDGVLAPEEAGDEGLELELAGALPHHELGPDQVRAGVDEQPGAEGRQADEGGDGQERDAAAQEGVQPPAVAAPQDEGQRDRAGDHEEEGLEERCRPEGEADGEGEQRSGPLLPVDEQEREEQEERLAGVGEERAPVLDRGEETQEDQAGAQPRRPTGDPGRQEPDQHRGEEARRHHRQPEVPEVPGRATPGGDDALPEEERGLRVVDAGLRPEREPVPRRRRHPGDLEVEGLVADGGGVDGIEPVDVGPHRDQGRERERPAVAGLRRKLWVGPVDAHAPGEGITRPNRGGVSSAGRTREPAPDRSRPGRGRTRRRACRPVRGAGSCTTHSR